MDSKWLPLATASILGQPPSITFNPPPTGNTLKSTLLILNIIFTKPQSHSEATPLTQTHLVTTRSISFPCIAGQSIYGPGAFPVGH